MLPMNMPPPPPPRGTVERKIRGVFIETPSSLVHFIPLSALGVRVILPLPKGQEDRPAA